MSNNAAERAVRGIAVGRKNWTFCGSDSDGRRAAAIYTLIETWEHTVRIERLVPAQPPAQFIRASLKQRGAARPKTSAGR